jgi:hypothetical protein
LRAPLTAAVGTQRAATVQTARPPPRPCELAFETNRPQLNDDATVDERNPLDAMRLPVVEPNNITRGRRS